MKIKYRDIRLGKANKERLAQINSIISEYKADGYILTLRQLYYQLVSRDVIPNKTTEYAKLSTLLKEGRMGGIVDWDAIEDRLRQPYSPNQFEGTDDAMDTIIGVYALPRQRGQDTYIEVWVEKDALSGVLKRVTSKYHIPIVVNRGYSSVTAMHDAYNRLKDELQRRKNAIVIYLGDFDPSGQDMIRDIKERLLEFAGDEFTDEYFNVDVVPIALTMKQIEQYDPPPNPAKITDPRADKYILQHGTQSWEVDALPPKVLNKILEDKILEYLNIKTYQNILIQEKIDKAKLRQAKYHIEMITDVDEEE